MNSYDPFQVFREFENEFTCYQSKRAEIEEVENLWLANDLTGTHPREVDLAFDNAENTVFNNEYKVKVAGIIYQLTAEGLIAMGGEEVEEELAPEFCFTNRHDDDFFIQGNRRFEINVAVNSWFIRSGAKGKVNSYTSKWNGWRRSRAELAVSCGGRIFNNNCDTDFLFLERNPAPSGFKNRTSLKIARHTVGQIWKTQDNMVFASFDFKGQLQGGVYLVK